MKTQLRLEPSKFKRPQKGGSFTQSYFADSTPELEPSGGAPSQANQGPPSVDHSTQPVPETGHEGKIDVTVTYSVYGSGDIVADVEVNPDAWLPPLARVGLHMVVPHELKVRSFLTISDSSFSHNHVLSSLGIAYEATVASSQIVHGHFCGDQSCRRSYL